MLIGKALNHYLNVTSFNFTSMSQLCRCRISRHLAISSIPVRSFKLKQHNEFSTDSKESTLLIWDLFYFGPNQYLDNSLDRQVHLKER